MKTEDLKAKGLTDEQISFVMAENGKDVNGLRTQVTNLTAERDSLKTQLTTTETALNDLKGKNPEQLEKTITQLRQELKDQEDKYKNDLYERDFTSALTAAVEEVKFTSEFAKQAVIEQIKAAKLTMVDGKIVGLNDTIEIMRKKDPGAFVDEQQEQNRAGAARFADPGNNPGKGGTVTKEQFIKMSMDERIALKQSNPDLYAALKK